MLSIVGENYKEWAEKYNIRLKDLECKKCKVVFTATIPVSDHGMRGLRIPDHGCPPEYNHSYYVIVDEDLRDKLINAIGDL